MVCLRRIRQSFANKLSRCYLHAAVQVAAIMQCCSLLTVASSMDNEALKHVDLPPCALFLAPSTIPGTGFGVFAGSAFEKDELLPRTWKTMFLPNNFPKSQVVYNYVFGYNETHMTLVLDYGSVLNHHESANVNAVRFPEWPPEQSFQFRALKDIEAGQEILVRYNSAQWFESKNIPYSEVDYASTMWQPDLQPLPCRKNVNLTIGEDGRPIFSVPAMLPPGTVMDVSPCVTVSIIVVDQFHLWDFVLIDPTTLTVCIPLSYIAQIPTTTDPNLANVRVTLHNLDHNVKGSANVMASVVTTHALRAGDSLLRHGEAFEDDTDVFSAQSGDELNRAVYDCCRDGITLEDDGPLRLLGPIGNWDVSQVTDMSMVFSHLKTFDYTLSNWDVSRVTNMTAMFHHAKAFNQDLSSWNVSCVLDMKGMFAVAESFNQDLSSWDVSRVTYMGAMFGYAKAFDQDLSNWNVSRVTYMGAMFRYALSFDQTLSNWDVSRVTDMGVMFDSAKFFNQDLSNWDVSRVTYMVAMFRYALSFNQDLSNWDVSRVVDMQSMFANASNFEQKLCGAAWVNSKASKVDMFAHSPGSILDAGCVFSPQSLDELKHAVDDCAQFPKDDRA